MRYSTKTLFISIACGFILIAIGNANAYVHGNFWQSCHNCHVRGQRVSCDCQTADDNWRFTRIRVNTRCRFVENVDGQLQCTRWFHRRHHFSRRDFRAGPIWNQDDAENKCPSVCLDHRARWTGQWHTVREGRMSVCQCKKLYW